MSEVRKLRELPESERPRERLQSFGARSLSTSELLAVIIGTGGRNETVTSLTQRMLIESNGLMGLMQMDSSEIAQFKGVGQAKAAQIKAAMELGSRMTTLGPDSRPQISTPDEAVALIKADMVALSREELRVILLDTKNRVIAIRTVYRGTINQADVRLAEIFTDAVKQTAKSLIVAHNHPSGDPTPSAEDVALTAQLVHAGKILDIDVVDHVILGRDRFVSLRRLGLGFERTT